MGLSLALLWNNLEARELLRGGPSSTGTATTATDAGTGTTAVTAPAVASQLTRLHKTKDILKQVSDMQKAAQQAAAATASQLTDASGNKQATVPDWSWDPIDPKTGTTQSGSFNGLTMARGVPQDLAHPAAGEDASLWTGAGLPVVNADTKTVTIPQTDQQAILNWQSFNIGKGTTLNFDQQAGGTNVGQWIVFNKIGVTGSPSQILGTINTLGLPDANGVQQPGSGGQVYVINPNGIIFGGSAQVNAHALVASSLPINDNLVSRGLLNNPDAQFLFSSLPQTAGQNGTPAFTPVVIDEFLPPSGTSGIPLNRKLAAGSSPSVTYVSASTAAVILKAGVDYNLSKPAADGTVSVAFTSVGLNKKPAGTSIIQVTYTPTGDQYGNVEVQAGATLKAPTNADHVGGRVALIGRNVSNAGTISTEDGQTILAAGLQIALAPHNSADATLRGLDVFVGAVVDPALNVSTTASDGTVTVTNTGNPAGTATNAGILNSDQTIANMGLIEAPRGAVTITGQTVNQNGFIESSTSVAYNGRVDLVAGYNAVANSKYDPTGTDHFTLSPFVYQSNAGDAPTGQLVPNSGPVTLGPESVISIMPETGSSDRVVGDLALPSQVNLQGGAVHFATDATVLAPGAAVPLNPAFGSDGIALDAGVTIRAGNWFNPGSNGYKFVQSQDSQQIYFDQGAGVYVAGLTNADPTDPNHFAASVTENIVSVELRGSELANSPLQQNGPLRGQTVQVDVRQHGPWNPTLNGGLGGYTWVGTPLADTSGWVGLATHSVGELTVNGGSVSLKAGGAVVLNQKAVIDVSGGAITYAGGVTQTTKVISSGHIYDISQATPDRVYDGIYTGTTTTTDPKWGVTTTTTSSLAQITAENGYTQGGNGGSLSIAAPVMALDGTLRGTTTSYAGQRTLSPLYAPGHTPLPANPAVVGEPGWLLNALNLPVPAQLSLTVKRQYLSDAGTALDYVDYSPTPADIVFGRTASPALGVNDTFNATGLYAFPANRNYVLNLSPDLVSGTGAGFGILSVNNSDDNDGKSPLYNKNSTVTNGGGITVAHGTVLALPDAGSLSLAAANITVERNTTATESTGILAPSGSISLNAFDVSPSQATEVSTLVSNGTVAAGKVPQYSSTKGNITMGTGALIDASGAVVDDRLNTLTAGNAPLITTGGTVELNASGVLLNPTSEVDVSGGGNYSANGKLAYADAGKIKISSGMAIKAGATGFGAVLGGGLQFAGAQLRGYAGLGKNGGSLSVQAPSITVVASLPGGTSADVATDAKTGAMSFTTGFFDDGGFSSFAFTGLGISVALNNKGSMTGALPSVVIGSPDTTAAGSVLPVAGASTLLQPEVQSWLSVPGGSVTTPDVRQLGPVRLTFNALGLLSNVNGDTLGNDTSLVLRNNVVVVTTSSLNSAVSFQGSTVDILGSVTAHGGSITVVDNKEKTLGDLPTVHLGPASVLDASGAAVSTLDNTGVYHATNVLDGGKITLDGNIVAEGAGTVKDEHGTTLADQRGARQGPGAILDVSGSADTVFLLPGDLADDLSAQSRNVLVPVAQSSNGGTLTLNAERELFSAATLLAGPGQPASGAPTTALGGNLVVSSAMKRVDNVPIQPTDPVLNLTAATPKFVYTKLGQQVTDGTKKYDDSTGFNLIWFGADSLSHSNLGGLSFQTPSGALQVQGNVALSASRQISLANGSTLLFTPVTTSTVTTPSTLTVTAPYVALGQAFLPPQAAAPSPLTVAPSTGSGVLMVQASSLIDVGNFVLRGAGSAVLDATYDPQAQGDKTNGTIRGDGTFEVAGDITLKAGQIYPPTADTFNIVAFDYLKKAGDLTLTPGSVTIQSAASLSNPNPAPLALPLSAGGALNIYASTITQGGTLRAPLGSIQLGAGSDSSVNSTTGASLPTTTLLTLQPGSVTSVSGLDPVTGKPVTVPYGINVNGDTWIDPTGTDITRIGPEAKSVLLAASTVKIQAATSGQPAATIDLSGGGDLMAYQFVPGTGGKSDILLGATAGSFAIVPGYTDAYAPLAPYNSSSDDAKANLGNDTGYVVGNAQLNYKVGDRIHIDLQGGQNPQDYTLLPARYALLPGAYLVTPQTTATTAGAAPAATKPDGSLLVAGYRFNGLDPAGENKSYYDSFEIASQAVVLKRAEYDISSANTFFTDLAKNNDVTAPRLPVDAGRLGLAVSTALNFNGLVRAQAATGGRGGMVDISSASDILIGSQTVISALTPSDTSGKIVLDAAELSGFGAESLLIGGSRTTGAQDTTVTVTSSNVTVNNAGEALTGSDIILVANQNLTLGKGAEIGQANQTPGSAEPLKVVGSVQLTKVSDTLAVERGGTAISLPGGSGANLLTATSAGTITNADGTTETFDASTAGTENPFQVSAGSTITLDTAGQLALAKATKPTMKPVGFVLGDGALVRVSNDPAAEILRSGVAASTTPTLTVGSGAKLAGTSVILDSTHTTSLATDLDLSAVNNLSLNSGRVSVLLDNPGTAIPTNSLVLSRSTQASLLKSAASLSLLSYSTVDFYGTGVFGSADLGSLALHAGAIRGYSNLADPTVPTPVVVAAKSVTLDNVANDAPTAVDATAVPKGALTISTSDALYLGGNQLDIQNYADVKIIATGGILAGDTAKLASKTGGLTVVGGNLKISTPLLAGASATTQSIAATSQTNTVAGRTTTTGGALSLDTIPGATTGDTTKVASGLGANLSLTGTKVDVGVAIKLPSGTIQVEATAGNLRIAGGALDVGGTAQQFYDVTKYTDGGSIALTADQGDLTISPGSSISVAANVGGGSAGALTVSVPFGHFDVAAGTLSGEAGTDGKGGVFSLDTVGIVGTDTTASHLATLSGALVAGGFDRAVTVRVRQGNVLADGTDNEQVVANGQTVVVDGTLRAHDITLSADHGDITVTGSLDASGLIDVTRADPLGGKMNAINPTGGSIDLAASGSVVLKPTAWLSAEGYAYSNDGKGGAISLAAGSYNGQVATAAKVDIQSGARLDLGVLHDFTPNDLLLATDKTVLPVSNRTDLFTGTLHLRESQKAFGDGTQFNVVAGSVYGVPSSIVLEGFEVFDLSNSGVSIPGVTQSLHTGGLINSTVQKAVKDNGTAFTNTSLLTNPLFHVQPGAEIVNTDPAGGDLTLATTWDLSIYRFGTGAVKEPGNLTLRATGDLIFDFGASLNDGFSLANAVNALYPLWTAKLMSDRSWSYRLVAGADYSAANSLSVQSLTSLNVSAVPAGSFLLGSGSATLDPALNRTAIVPQFFQTVRSGTGDITIAAGRDVQLLNPMATIYTAGTSAAPLPNFDIPVLYNPSNDLSAATFNPIYPAQYSQAGGNVTISAQNDIARYQIDSTGTLVAASSAELPSNWLYRRGHLDANGLFSSLTVSKAFTTEIQSTSWWIDFSNFFDDVGALGGGNVTLTAGRQVANINASVGTNARMPGKDAVGNPIKPDASKLVELGGGNLTVQAGGDIDGGVYYVERGDVTLHAGGSVKSNPTRAAFTSGDVSNPMTWLPTTFLLGKGQIDVTAGGDIRIGQVANPFWLPQGLNNRAYETTYFSTMASADTVVVSSLSGSVTLQGPASDINTASNGSGAWLLDWYANILSGDQGTLAAAQPWLKLMLNSGNYPISFQTVASVMPGTLQATAFSHDINVIGNLDLAPASRGTLDLLAAGSLNGLAINGVASDGSLEWRSSAINLSDADPARLPGITNPFSFGTYAQDQATVTGTAEISFLKPVDDLFAASGSTDLSLAQKLALHAQLLDPSGQRVSLHYNDPTSLHLYADGGDISGLTLYSGKAARVVAAQDITDIALYVQNVRPQDTTVVAAGRDLIAYDPASPLRQQAQQPGNSLVGVAGDTGPALGVPTTGDIQIAGPGTLEVLAGRNLDLGYGNNPTRDGTAAGFTSVGASLNPILAQYAGANIVAAAGVQEVYTSVASKAGLAPGLATTGLDYADFIKDFLNPGTDPANVSAEAARYLPELATLMDYTASKVPADIWNAFAFDPSKKPLTEQQALWVQDIFALVLRNAARDRNNPDSPDAGTYKAGFAAIADLFPDSPQPTEDDLKSTLPVVRPAGLWAGNLSLSTREIKTFEGGNISLIAPGGGVTVGRATDPQKPDQGILTQRGGGISIFAADSVNVGTSRIFTLRGGNEILWSTWGNIAAGSGSKTVFSAPPTRVLIDPQSGDVQNDLAGLATGSGIGVLATLAGVKPGDVDLIAPVGTIDAGDAGIRSSGNLNIAARVVLNASNIQVGGTSAGTPPPPPPPTPPPPPPAPVDQKSSGGPIDQQNAKNREKETEEARSLIIVEVLGYGGPDDDIAATDAKSDDEKKKKEEEDGKKRNSVEVSVPLGR